MSHNKKAAKRILKKWDCNGWRLFSPSYDARICLMHGWMWDPALPFCNSIGKTKRDALELAYTTMQFSKERLRKEF